MKIHMMHNIQKTENPVKKIILCTNAKHFIYNQNAKTTDATVSV